MCDIFKLLRNGEDEFRPLDILVEMKQEARDSLFSMLKRDGLNLWGILFRSNDIIFINFDACK